MDFSVPVWAVYTASWFGMIGGGWSLFDRAESVVNKDTKVAVSKWLKNVQLPSTESWPVTFQVIFRRVFGEKHFSFKCIGMSVLASAAFIAIFLALWVAVHPDKGFEFFSNSTGWIAVLFVAALINLLPDYISLLETRIILTFLAKKTSYKWITILLIADFLFTGLVFFVGFSFCGLVLGTSDFWGILTTGLVMDSPENINVSLGPFIYSTYATSIWLWLYVISGSVSKINMFGNLSIQKFKSIIDIDEKPIRSLGFISMLLVSICYLAIPILRLITE